MPCAVKIAEEVKSDVLGCNPAAKREFHDFLLKLQDFPLPEGRKK